LGYVLMFAVLAPKRIRAANVSCYLSLQFPVARPP
jgi:hypothetical protein